MYGDQRFLGDKRFVEQIDERIRAERQIEVPGPTVKFSELLRLTAEAYGVNERSLVNPGRQRKWVKARSILVYLARKWGRASVKEIGRRLHRDPSIISRCTQRTRQIATAIKRHGWRNSFDNNAI